MTGFSRPRRRPTDTQRLLAALRRKTQHWVVQVLVVVVVVVVGQSSEAVLEAEERMVRNQGGPALAKNLIRKVPGITWGRQIVQHIAILV